MTFKTIIRAALCAALILTVHISNANIGVSRIWIPESNEDKNQLTQFIDKYQITLNDIVIIFNSNNCDLCKQVLKNSNSISKIQLFINTSDTNVLSAFKSALNRDDIKLIQLDSFRILSKFLANPTVDIAFNIQPAFKMLKYLNIDYNNFDKTINELIPILKFDAILNQKIQDFDVCENKILTKDPLGKFFLINQNDSSKKEIQLLDNVKYDSSIIPLMRKYYAYSKQLNTAKWFDKMKFDKFRTYSITYSKPYFIITATISFSEIKNGDTVEVFARHCLIQFDPVTLHTNYRFLNFTEIDKKLKYGRTAPFRFLKYNDSHILVGRYFTFQDSNNLYKSKSKHATLFLELYNTDYKTINIKKNFILNTFKYNSIYGQMPCDLINNKIFFINNPNIYDLKKQISIEPDWLKYIFNNANNEIFLKSVTFKNNNYYLVVKYKEYLLVLIADNKLNLIDFHSFKNSIEINAVKYFNNNLYLLDNKKLYLGSMLVR